jgi:hypothetical protein
MSGTRRLRYPGRCVGCGVALPAGSVARWDPATRRVTCGDCLAREAAAAGALPDVGVAGGSARREYERRQGRREKQVRDAHPWLGELILALSEDPQHVRAFGVGAAGETALGRELDELTAGRDAVTVHDRRITRPRGQIDHVAVGPSGVFVIDAKNYTGMVAIRGTGFLGLGEARLFVGRRDVSALAGKMTRQVDAVRGALAGLPEAAGVPVTPVLAFVDAEWPLFRAPDEYEGVLIEGEGSTCRLVAGDGPLPWETCVLLAHRIAQRLPVAR